ncbi:peptidoglycan-binding protein [Streptomyces sp. NBRC 110035]|uniref:peptidoglycan-binding domain-containing protein n=1 Tax=Streptomyces sp. NBRC 110035 TaxID=1547867 RepID=UPI0005A66744|nr:peptidoglycan-binding domain-containing protein [Streptomyces sp. NBRC 110035]
MNDSTGTPCPECGTPRNRDNTPSCACTLRASEALRDARTAQAAQAEDFTPLRIRPYVELDDGTTAAETEAGAGAASTPNAAPEDGGAPDGGRAPEREAGQGAEEARTPDEPNGQGTPAARAGRAEQSERTARAGQTAPGAPGPAADATVQLRAVTPDTLAAPGTAGAPTAPDSRPAPLAAPLAPPTTEPSATDLHLFDSTRPLRTVPTAAGPPAGPATPPLPAVGDAAPPGGGRRRRTALLVAAGTVVAVIGAAGWASGLFAYETPSRDGASADDVRAGVPDAPDDAPSAAPVTSASGSPEASAPASASATPSGSASPSASPSGSESAEASTPAAPSDEPEPSATPTTVPSADAPEDAEELDGGDATGPTLKRGDRGPEVAALQERLSKVYLYNDEVNGRFDRDTEGALRNYQWSRGIRGDELGVYGPETRTRLESETQDL